MSMGFLDKPMNTHLLRALDLWGFMGIVRVDYKGEDESAALIHACGNHATVSNLRIYRFMASAKHPETRWGAAYPTFVRGNGEGEVQEISGIWEMGLHGRREVEFCQVWQMYAPEFLLDRDRCKIRPTFLDTNLGCAGLRLLLSGRLLGLLHAPYL